MGNTVSSANMEDFFTLYANIVKLRTYRPPDVRQKDRFEASDKGGSQSLFDASIDKYDYLIIFPLTEGPFVKAATNEEGKTIFSDSRISWKKISQIWRQSVPGTDESKELAVKALAHFWQNRVFSYPEDSDEIPVKVFITIAREAILDQFSSKSGLQLKLSNKGSFLYCRVRAPIKLLEQQAKKENYRLQFKGEIDPGSEEFWNREVTNTNDNSSQLQKYQSEKKKKLNAKVSKKGYSTFEEEDEDDDDSIIEKKQEPISLEIEEEKRIYSLNEANIILEKLYRVDKISPNDLGVNKEKETPIMWSRRVHALERIADQVYVWNKFPAYAPFSPEPHLRYLFQTYPSVRGKTLFRAKDRLYLTKSILDHYFDLEVLANEKVINSVTALHDANRGEKLTIDILMKRWVTFWAVPASEVGAPRVTDQGVEDSSVYVAPWFLIPFCQPLNDIRDYFGEKTAFFYAWLGSYTYSLIFIAFAGVLTQILYSFVYTDSSSFARQFLHFTFLLIVIVRSAYGVEKWKQEEYAIALKWGTLGLEEEEKTRPQFQGDSKEPFRRSVVTNRSEVYYPESRRQSKKLLYFMIIIGSVALILFFIACIFYFEYFLTHIYSFQWGCYLCSFLLAIQIKIHSYYFSGMIIAFNEWENYRTEKQYEDNLIFKTFFFEGFNNYFSLVYTAFIKGNIFNICVYSCIADLQLLLYFIFLIRYIYIAFELVNAVLSNFSNNESQEKKEKEMVINRTKKIYEEETECLSIDDSETHFLLEVDKEKAESTLFHFKDIVLQYGLQMFITAYPLIALLSLIENLIEFRLHAWRLCALCRRPHVAVAEDVGFWSYLLDTMSTLAAITNVGILCFTTTTLSDFTIIEKCLVFLVLEQCLLLIKLVVHFSIESKPDDLVEIAERQKYIIRKFLLHIDDQEDMDQDVTNIIGNLEDSDALEAMKDLNEMKRDTKMGEDNYSKTEELEAKKRDLLHDLRIVKDQLQTASKTEVLNQQTGIGETKHGLPLGRLTCRLVEMQNLSAALGDPNKMSVKVKVNIQGYRREAKPAGPLPSQYTETAVYQLSSATSIVAFNQSLGPFAPIRTLDADVVFDVVDVSPDSNEAIVASASVKLRDLHDQQQHDKVLYLYTRKPNGQLEISNTAKLFVQLTFLYSNIVPLRTRVYHLQDKLRQIEKEMSNLKKSS